MPMAGGLPGCGLPAAPMTGGPTSHPGWRNWCARATASGSRPRSLHRRRDARRSSRFMPSTTRWRRRARWCASRCSAACACNGGARPSPRSMPGGPLRRHDVIAAVAAAIRAHRMTRAHFEALIEAREADLADAPPPTLAALAAYAEGSAGRTGAARAGGPGRARRRCRRRRPRGRRSPMPWRDCCAPCPSTPGQRRLICRPIWSMPRSRCRARALRAEGLGGAVRSRGASGGDGAGTSRRRAGAARRHRDAGASGLAGGACSRSAGSSAWRVPGTIPLTRALAAPEPRQILRLALAAWRGRY